jgi:signal transduction histidine kinase
MRRDANGHTSLSTPSGANTHAQRAAVARLRRLESLFGDFDWADRRAFVRARKRAHERGVQVLQAGPGGDVSAALLLVAIELFTALRLELADQPVRAADLVQRLADAGVSRVALAKAVLRAPELLALPPEVALRAQLGLLIALVPLRNSSLWTGDGGERVECRAHAGDGGPSRGAGQLAKALLSGEHVESGGRRVLLGVPVGPVEHPVAAVVGHCSPGAREAAEALMDEAVPMLAALLHREILLAENAAAELALIEASERKLMRLGFDLHDGPIQDVAVIADDLRLFRDQLEVALGSFEQRKLVDGRIEDLAAQLGALDAGLRRLSGEVQAASVLLNRPFATALRDRVRAFAARTGIEPRLTLRGDMGVLSTSQQIALLNIVQEALSNVREHADASSVEVAVSADPHGIEARISDDGRGFDLEATLMRTAREGRIGLLATNERVRLLGGRCRIDSRPGGPTVVTVTLERWLPTSIQRQANGAPKRGVARPPRPRRQPARAGQPRQAQIRAGQSGRAA